MTNTMDDLRRLVASRIHDSLHGKEIDTLVRGMPELPHMLGIVPVGAISTTEAEVGTILDPGHEFWQDYYTDIDTKGSVKREIETAIRSLKDDDLLTVSYPYGEDGDIVYVECDVPGEAMLSETECAECGATVSTGLDVNYDNRRGAYRVSIDIECPDCGFDREFGRTLARQG